MVSLDLLENIEAFKDLNDDQLVSLQSLCEEIEFKRDDRLFAQGEDSAHLWFMIKG